MMEKSRETGRIRDGERGRVRERMMETLGE